jgi:hypothetical protein
MIKKLILLLGLLAINTASAAERFEKGELNLPIYMSVMNQYSYFIDNKHNIICYERTRGNGIALSCVSLDKGVSK